MYPIARPKMSSLTGTRFRLFPQSPESGLFSVNPHAKGALAFEH